MFVFSVPRAAKLPMEMLYIYAGCRATESSLQNEVSIFSLNSKTSACYLCGYQQIHKTKLSRKNRGHSSLTSPQPGLKILHFDGPIHDFLKSAAIVSNNFQVS